MKTNFLYFKERNLQQYTATSAQTSFTVNNISNWDSLVTAKGDVRVKITSLAANAGNVGTAYASNSNSVAGTTYILDSDGGYSYNSDAISITTKSGSGAKGYDLKAGDIVVIEKVHAEQGVECCFRADAFLAVVATGATTTTVHFQGADGGAKDDTITFTHAAEDGANYKKICEYFSSVLSSQAANKDGFIVVADRDNGVVAPELVDAGITRMALVIA